MRTKLVTILCVLLLAVMSVSFGAAFAAGTDSGSDADTLTVEAVGWGGNAEQAKTTGFTGIDNATDMGMQIWFSDAIRSSNTTVLLGSEASIQEEVTQSALKYIVINGKTLGDLLDSILAINGGKADTDQILQVHVQGEQNNLQFSFRKNNKTVNEGKYSALPDCFFNIDAETKRPTDDNAVTIKAGFTAMGKTVKEDVSFVFVPDTGNGRWVADTAEEAKIASIIADDTKNDEVSITVKFEKAINKETVNHMARELEATVIAVNGGGAVGAAKLDNIKANGLRESVWNKLVINGYTIWQLMQDAKIDAPEGGDVAGAVDVHVKAEEGNNSIEIHIKNGFNSSISLEDGTTVSFLGGFRSDLGKFTEDVTYTYTDGTWAEEGTAVVREELKINSVTSKDDTANNEIAIYIEFDQPINRETVNHMARESEATIIAVNGGGETGAAKLDNIKANGLRESVWNKISIGGKTIAEIMAAAKADLPDGDYDGLVDVHVKAGADGNKMEIHIKKDFSGSVALADDLELTFAAGFRSDLVTVSEDILYTYVDGAWYAEGEEPAEQQEVSVSNVVHKDGTTDLEITITFSNAISATRVLYIARDNEQIVIAQNGGGAAGQAVLNAVKANGLRDSIYNNLAINGKTIRQIMDDILKNPTNPDDPASELDVHVEGSNDVYNTVRIVMKQASKLVDLSKDVTLTVKSGFHSDRAMVSSDITYTYDADLKFWLAPGEEAPSFDPVAFVGVDAPIMKDAAANYNVEFVLNFDEDIDNRQHAYISMPAEFVGSFVGSSGDYSATELNSFTKYGVFDSMAHNILVNGKSVYEMMKVDETKYPLAVQPAIAVVHSAQGGTGLNTLRVVIGGIRVEGTTTEDLPFRITDLNQNFVITVKAGLRTPLGQEVKEDMSFIYDPVSQQWYEGDSVEDIPVHVTVTFMDGETVLSTQSCLKGETVTAGIARKEGYTFEGWFTDAACTKAWDSSAPVNEDITVYAKFTAIENGGNTEPGTDGGCNSAIFGGVAVLSVGLVAAAAVLLKRRNRI